MSFVQTSIRALLTKINTWTKSQEFLARADFRERAYFDDRIEVAGTIYANSNLEAKGEVNIRQASYPSLYFYDTNLGNNYQTWVHPYDEFWIRKSTSGTDPELIIKPDDGGGIEINNIDVKGNIDIDGNLNIDGTIDAVDINAIGDVDVTGNITGDRLTANNVANFNATAYFNSNLEAYGEVNIKQASYPSVYFQDQTLAKTWQFYAHPSDYFVMTQAGSSKVEVKIDPDHGITADSLKVGTASYSGTIAPYGKVELTLPAMSFFPSIQSTSNSIIVSGHNTIGDADEPRFGLANSSGNTTIDYDVKVQYLDNL